MTAADDSSLDDNAVQSHLEASNGTCESLLGTPAYRVADVSLKLDVIAHELAEYGCEKGSLVPAAVMLAAADLKRIHAAGAAPEANATLTDSSSAANCPQAPFNAKAAKCLPFDETADPTDSQQEEFDFLLETAPQFKAHSLGVVVAGACQSRGGSVPGARHTVHRPQRDSEAHTVGYLWCRSCAAHSRRDIAGQCHGVDFGAAA